MIWTLKYDKSISKKLKRLGKTASNQIIKYLETTVSTALNPHEHGKQLKGSLREYWCYRTGDYRIICKIEDEVITIFVVDVGHRKNIY